MSAAAAVHDLSFLKKAQTTSAVSVPTFDEEEHLIKMTVEMASDLEAASEEDANECPACGHPVFQAEALLAGKHHTRAKINFYPKIHIFKISFFAKFTFSKSHFSQNSHFQNLILRKIHNFIFHFS